MTGERSKAVKNTRKMIHIDMDAFFAAVEQRDDPSLRGQPVIVGGSPYSRGVVATASYEARQFGIHSAMPAAQAKRLCPHAIFLHPRLEVYREISWQIRQLFDRVTTLVEPASLDEAYLDVTASQMAHGSATRIAEWLKQRIREQTGLVASAGVSYNKFLAKLACDMDKPDGLKVIRPDQGEQIIAALPIGRFHGIGRATEARMQALGIHTGADLKATPVARLQRHFGRQASYYLALAHAQDPRPVVPYRPRKSLGTQTTFAQDLIAMDDIRTELIKLAEELVDGLNQRQLCALTITLKVKYADFTLITRSLTPGYRILGQTQLQPLLGSLLQRTNAGRIPLRLLGITASNLRPLHNNDPIPEQLDLFAQPSAQRSESAHPNRSASIRFDWGTEPVP